MRATWACVALLTSQLAAQDSYTAILAEYHSGDPAAALARLGRLDSDALDAGFKSFATKPSTLSHAAAAMHTEAAVRSPIPLTARVAARHLELAAAIVEFTERGPRKSNTSRPLPASSPLSPVSPGFRRMWYVAVITAFEGKGQLATADGFLERARDLYPGDTEIALLSAVEEEMGLAVVKDADYRRKGLERAEKYLRTALTADPDRPEVRLRLGRVLQLRGIQDARQILIGVSKTDDVRIAYLAALFLGAFEDAAGAAGAAEHWYTQAAARVPQAQAARLALSELRHRSGDHAGAAGIVTGATTGPRSDIDDPWWGYLFGEHWKAAGRLDVLRAMRRH